jgi:pimeloyl-ACP methyl ester carboxylesterase
MPFHGLKMWGKGLAALVPLGVGAYYFYRSFNRPRVAVAKPGTASRDLAACHSDPGALQQPTGYSASLERHRHAPQRLGMNREFAILLGSAALLGWSLGGGRALSLLGRPHGEKPRAAPGKTVRRLLRPDGTELHVTCSGQPDGLPIVFVHGLGGDSDEWFAIRERLADRYLLIDWDLPGFGKSTMSRDRDGSLETLAGDLEAVLAVAGNRPAILFGHSFGGMVLLTFCRLYPGALGGRVAGLVLAHTTYTNPVNTNARARLYAALQKPVIEPIFRLGIRLSPLIRFLCILTYLSGSAHRSLAETLFVGTESRELLDFLASYYLRAWPAAYARFSLGMFRYDETATLKTISVPTLVVTGDQDQICTPAGHIFMRDCIPEARLLTLSPAKHGGLLEYPQRFTEALQEFVGACASGVRPGSAA